jgi:hypothetical protein
MKRSELIALLQQVGARGPVTGPEKAWVVPSTSVDRLADSLGTPAQLQAGYREVDVMNVDTAVLHGVFTAAELKAILARMKALGKSR